jgi:hypothetical protein
LEERGEEEDGEDEKKRKSPRGEFGDPPGLLVWLFLLVCGLLMLAGAPMEESSSEHAFVTDWKVGCDKWFRKPGSSSSSLIRASVRKGFATTACGRGECARGLMREGDG